MTVTNIDTTRSYKQTLDKAQLGTIVLLADLDNIAPENGLMLFCHETGKVYFGQGVGWLEVVSGAASTLQINPTAATNQLNSVGKIDVGEVPTLAQLDTLVPEIGMLIICLENEGMYYGTGTEFKQIKVV